MNLFDVIKEYDALIAEIEDAGGEVTPEIAEKLTINEKNLKDKIHAYYYIIKLKEAEITLAKEEQERLMIVRKAKDGVIKRLKKIVDLAVEVYGVLKPSGAKGLDLGDLKVWQKKTEALEIIEGGTINDERFCKKQITITIPYNKEILFYSLIKDFDFTGGECREDIIIDNAKLKEWLIEHEDYLKALKDKAEDIAIGIDKFENENIQLESDKIPIINEIEDKDLKIALNASIKHNSTVIFK